MSSQAERKSLSELERETEHTRADLIHTVDKLQNRVSPRAIKEGTIAYARETSNELVHTIERKIRDNPLPTVAVAAAFAYPAWRILINIPAPILLVGAGLALSHIGSKSAAREANSSADEEGEEFSDNLKRTARGAASNLSHAAEGLKGKVADAADDARSGVASGVESVRSSVSDTAQAARAAGSDALAAATHAVSATYSSGIDAASRTSDELNETFRRSKARLIESIERHPFMVGSAGLLVGAAIAAVLPVSQAEDRLLGDNSDELKRRARDMASQGLEIAKTTADDVYQESISRAQAEGLNTESVRQTVKDVGDKVTNVMQHAADALDDKSENATPPAPSIVHHK
jgi:Protein of unknown function (DUF3618)